MSGLTQLRTLQGPLFCRLSISLPVAALALGDSLEAVQFGLSLVWGAVRTVIVWRQTWCVNSIPTASYATTPRTAAAAATCSSTTSAAAKAGTATTTPIRV
jgi:hypothetical protein